MLAEHQIRLPAVTLESADGKARAVLEKAQAAVGFIPKTPLVAHGETNIAPDEFGRFFDCRTVRVRPVRTTNP